MHMHTRNGGRVVDTRRPSLPDHFCDSPDCLTEWRRSSVGSRPVAEMACTVGAEKPRRLPGLTLLQRLQLRMSVAEMRAQCLWHDIRQTLRAAWRAACSEWLRLRWLARGGNPDEAPF
jgi:hypothetical protein